MKTENIREVSLEEIADLPVHPVADIFPMLAENSTDRENGKVDKQTITLSELADSIKDNGLQEPIVLYTCTDSHGEIITWLLDGRNRRSACVLGKIETVLVEDFIGTEEEAETYILNLNIDRRDLTPGQRAFAAAKYWEMEAEKAESRKGRRTDLGVNLPRGSDFGRTKELLSTRFRVSDRYVAQAHKELEAIETARQKAVELQEQAAELERVAEEADAKIELAKAEGRMEAVKEAVIIKNEANNNKDDLRERAAEAAEAASSKARKATRVQRGETMNSVYGESKPQEKSDDPIGQLRTGISSSISTLNQKISDLADVSGQGEEEYNFVAGRLNKLIEHFKIEFGMEVEKDEEE